MKKKKKYNDAGHILIEALKAYHKNYKSPIDMSKIYWIKFNNASNTWEMTEESKNGR